jgi:hypothetical protein
LHALCIDAPTIASLPANGETTGIPNMMNQRKVSMLVAAVSLAFASALCRAHAQGPALFASGGYEDPVRGVEEKDRAGALVGTPLGGWQMDSSSAGITTHAGIGNPPTAHSAKSPTSFRGRR